MTDFQQAALDRVDNAVAIGVFALVLILAVLGVLLVRAFRS